MKNLIVALVLVFSTAANANWSLDDMFARYFSLAPTYTSYSAPEHSVKMDGMKFMLGTRFIFIGMESFVRLSSEKDYMVNSVGIGTRFFLPYWLSVKGGVIYNDADEFFNMRRIAPYVGGGLFYPVAASVDIFGDYTRLEKAHEGEAGIRLYF